MWKWWKQVDNFLFFKLNQKNFLTIQLKNSKVFEANSV